MAQKKQPKVVTDIIKALKTGSIDDQKKALKKIPSKGTPEMIGPLFDLHEMTNSTFVQQEIEKIIGTLKDTACIEPLVDQLERESEVSRQFALRSMWHCGMDFNEHLDRLVQVAIDGSFMEAFEVLTIVENLNPPIEEEVTMNCLLILKQHFIEPREGEKNDLLRQITAIIKTLDENLDD